MMNEKTECQIWYEANIVNKHKREKILDYVMKKWLFETDRSYGHGTTALQAAWDAGVLPSAFDYANGEE